MSTEAATFISDLDSTNPQGTQGAGFGDDHLRMLKAVLQASFPSITGAVTLTQAQINALGSANITAGTGISATGTIVTGQTVALDTGSPLNVDHSAVSITGGGGLTGGGTIESNRTIELDTASSRNLDHNAIAISGGGGLTGGGSISANRTISLDTNSSRNVDHDAVSTIAGAGLTGGGTHAASRTIDVGAGNGITASADAVSMSGSFTGTFTATVDVRAGSDRALKESISAIENPLEMVRAMQGRHYWRKDIQQHQFGVIAQEHARVQPEAVGRDEDSGYLVVAYQQITPVLIEAVKVLAARVEALEEGR